jgi:hypothetical protein
MIVEDEPITAEDLQETLVQVGQKVTSVVATAANASDRPGAPVRL